MNADRARTVVWSRTGLLVAAVLLTGSGAAAGDGATLARDRIPPEAVTSTPDHSAPAVEHADSIAAEERADGAAAVAAEPEGDPASRDTTAGLEAVRRFRSTREHTASPQPTSIRVPAIAVESPLVTLGVEPDGSVEVPSDSRLAGWFRESARPGQTGPAVILGHVDSKAGPAVFYRLHELDPGDEILVERVDGSTIRFVVDRVERHHKDDFPTQAVYYPTLEPALRLITCGGVFDAQEGSYNDNVIVFATLTS